MTKEQILKHLEIMKEHLEAMKQDKIDASAFHKEDSEFMADLDMDILLCSATINDLTIQLNNKR